MGFDLRMLEEPVELGQEYQPEFDDDPGGFQMTSAGMGIMVEVMHKAGVLEFDTSEPQWPWPTTVLPAARAELLEEWVFMVENPEVEPTEEEKRLLMPVRDEIDRAKRCRSVQPGKVPAFKFSTNDGWIVVPQECLAITQGLKAAIERDGAVGFLPSEEAIGLSEKEVKDWVLNWAAFNELAARHGGYSID